MSSTFSSDLSANYCMDHVYSTICATGASSPGSNWIAVQLIPGTHVGAVAVHNRRDAYAYMLGSFEVWVGASAGDMSSESAARCGEASYDEQSEPDPYVIQCVGAMSSESVTWVTVRQTTCPSTCIFALAEIDVAVELSLIHI